MKTLILFTFAAAVLSAQTAIDAHTAIKSAVLSSTPALTLTASQGDGGTCVLTKLNGGQINLGVTCSSADGKTVNRSTITSQATGASCTDVLFGDILCLIALNPTSAPVTMGSLGTAPSKGVAWSCTTAITGGGNTPIASGSVSWP